MIIRALLALAFLIGPAFGQTVTGPQTVNPPNVVSGADSSGNFTQRQVEYTDLAFPTILGLATTASNQLTVATGDQVVYLNYDPGFQLGYVVQIISLVDPQAWMVGRISNYTNDGFQTQITVSVTQESGDSFTDAAWYVQIISSDSTFIPITGVSLSALTFGTSAGQISQGGVVSLTTESGLLLNNSHIVVTAIGSPGNYFRGIGQYNSSTGALTIYTTDSSGSGTFSAWSLFAQDGPPINANQIAVSQSNATLASGIIPFTIQAGQNLPIQGPVTITALSATSNQMLGTIYAYSGTTLSVQVPAAGIYGSGNFGAWSIENTGPAQSVISPYQINGLRMTQGASSYRVNIDAGSVADSTGSVTLTLPSAVVLNVNAGGSDVVKVAQSGTVDMDGTGLIVTGHSTAFLSNFSATATLTDLNNQFAVINQPSVSLPSLFSTSTHVGAAPVATVTNDTSMTISVSTGGAESGLTAYRGGPPDSTSTVAYGIVLSLDNSTGISSISASSFTPSGVPDLPSGHTYYRVIGYVQGISGVNVFSIYQPLLFQRKLTPTAVYSATITPTSVSGSVSSVNATTNVITWSTTHGLTTGQSVRGIGTVPNGWTVGRMFYVNALSTTTFALYTTYANAIADTGRVTLGNTTTGATMVTLVPSNAFSAGFQTTGAVGAQPGSTSMGFEFNLSNAMAATAGAVHDMAFGLFSTTPAQINRQWTMAGAPTLSTTTLIQTGTPGFSEDRAGVDNGTWVQQGTNAFTIQVWVWG